MNPLGITPPEQAPVPTVSADAPSVSFELSSLVETWKGKDHTAVLLKTDSLRVVFRSLCKGNSLSTHKAAGDITVQVLDGRIEFAVGDRTLSLEKGQVLALKAGTPHSLTAPQPASILITLAAGPRI